MVNRTPMSAHWNMLLAIAEDEVRRTIHQLPAPLGDRARALPCTCEHRPNADLQADGIAEDTLGLFVGEEMAETGATLCPMPAQIILFLDNLWQFADEDEDAYREEVRITYLHELGHYLGLNELDLDDRDLS
jgi:predicted Zn-dependent protease with MMP-like domain